jgi:hypothetical protein
MCLGIAKIKIVIHAFKVKEARSFTFSRELFKWETDAKECMDQELSIILQS